MEFIFDLIYGIRGIVLSFRLLFGEEVSVLVIGVLVIRMKIFGKALDFKV